MLNATMICRIRMSPYVRDENHTSNSITCLRNVSAQTHLAFQTRPVCGNTCFGMTAELQCQPNSALLHIEGRVLKRTTKGAPAGVRLRWPRRVEQSKTRCQQRFTNSGAWQQTNKPKTTNEPQCFKRSVIDHGAQIQN